MNAIRRAANVFLNFMGDLAEEIADMPAAARRRPHVHLTIQLGWLGLRQAQRRAADNGLWAVAGWGLAAILAHAEILARNI